MAKISVLNKEIVVYSQNDSDYISLTDMARYKDEDRTDYVIQNWLRNRTTVEFLGIWEQLYNPGFKPIEFGESEQRNGKVQDFSGDVFSSSRGCTSGESSFSRGKWLRL